jgi:torulene dioxygenase
LIEKIRKTGNFDGFTFAARYDPCRSFFQKMQAVFQPAQPAPRPNEVNVGVTFSANFPGRSHDGHRTERPTDPRNAMTLCTKTDANMQQFLDPETLEPIGLARQETLHPDLKGVGSGAHAKSDPETGDVYNYNLDFGRTGTFRIWRASPATGKTAILATFQHAPAYLHSLFLTEHYLVLCVWNSFYKAGGAAILWTRNLLDAMTWDPNRSATWFVIDKKSPDEGGKGVVAKYTSDAFFCFHTINAYEQPSATQPGATDVVCDLAAYENMDVLYHTYLDNLLSDSPKAHKTRESQPTTAMPSYRRYRLPDVSGAAKTAQAKAMLEHESSKMEAFELPIVSPRVVTKKHRYMYGIADTGKSTFVDSLVKYDADKHSTLRWTVHGHSPGEPIFVANPQGSEEDDGVLLSVVLDGFAGKSYLLVLNAKTMTEMGKAHVKAQVGFGFHGMHVSSKAPVSKYNGMHL